MTKLNTPKKYVILTEEQIADMINMYKQKVSQKVIADKYNCAVSKINYHIRKSKGYAGNYHKKDSEYSDLPERTYKVKCPFCKKVTTRTDKKWQGIGVCYEYCSGVKGKCAGFHKHSKTPDLTIHTTSYRGD